MGAENLTLKAALALLGLDEGADRDAVIRAYRRLARTTHPDLSDAADAAGKFDSLTAAYRRALDTAPTTASEAAAAPVVPSTPYVRPAGPGIWLGDGPNRPFIIVRPGRVDPLPAHRRRTTG
ncbi:hypothetical protein DDE18_04660 [Nocardioides gansuensis]|uniref:J domain-containing protein n=1 Tax=Nocardioides gansuensis TaxID=2138300 RepID=A0A2T8FD42_9ACTN|nr:DnaJ domain-containing protein [Nocardioides gansuensis]PVG83626.1 hypothetical protein DDE18_04660 [Nocardioides gansuensis]